LAQYAIVFLDRILYRTEVTLYFFEAIGTLNGVYVDRRSTSPAATRYLDGTTFGILTVLSLCIPGGYPVRKGYNQFIICSL
jgi:hypothetical protein